MPADPARRQRLLIRATLVAGMLLAGLGLVAVLKARPRGAAPPALARSGLRIQVVDPAGRVVRGAEVFVRSPTGAPSAQARWAPDEGVLMLPRGGPAHDLRVLARGYRVTDVAGVGSDRRIVLQPGLRLRVRVHDVPTEGLPESVRVMLRVRPLDAHPTGDGALGAEALVDLMDNLGGSGPRDIPRGAFGYPVSLEQARNGVLLPRPGRYHVLWGLFDLEAATWFSVGAQAGREVAVDEDAGGALLDLVMTPAALQGTLDGLRAALAKKR